MDKQPDKKKLPLKQRLKAAFNGVSRKDLGGIAKATLKDLRRPKEIGLLVVSSFIPGGWVGYGAYRVAKYKYNRPGNDNAGDTPKAPEESAAQKPAGKKPRCPIPPRRPKP